MTFLLLVAIFLIRERKKQFASLSRPYGGPEKNHLGYHSELINKITTFYVVRMSKFKGER